MSPVKGKWCAIVGAAGGLGHLAIQYAKNCFELKVLAVDGGDPKKKDFCEAMSSDEYVDFIATGDNLPESVRKKTGGGPDYVLVLSPHQSAYDAAGQYARFRSQIMAVGIGSCSIPLRPILQKDLSIRASETGTKEDTAKALDFLREGKVIPRIELVKFNEINEAMDRLKNGRVYGRLVIDMTVRPESVY